MMIIMTTARLQSLPVELLYEVQLISLSESLPLVSRYLFDVFKHAPPVFNARYVLSRVWRKGTAQIDIPTIYSRSLRYPICGLRVLQAIHQLVGDPYTPKRKPPLYVQLPIRFFRTLREPLNGWTDDDEPLPLLRYLCDIPDICIDVDRFDGYALTKAVRANFLPLVKFLLDHRASPKCSQCLAIRVAIYQKDLALLKLLVERPRKKNGSKPAKLKDRVQLDAQLLNLAIMVGAADIIDYLHHEKGVIPDLVALKRL